MGWRRRDQALTLIAPALLAAVALVQIWRAHVLDQSSWSGAGFGMFATYEHEGTRFFRVDADEAGGPTRRVSIPPDAADAALAARVVPTASNLARLGERLRLAGAVAPDATLRVQLWAIDYDHGTARVDAYVLREVVLDR